MQTGKIRRTVSKLRQLQDEFNSCPATDLALWTINRTPDSHSELPPGLSKAKSLFVCGFIKQSQIFEQYVTAAGPVDEQLFGALLSRTDDLLKQVNLAPEYHGESVLYAVADLSLRNRINRASPYYWQGGTKFAKSWVDRWQIYLPCLDWFSKVDRLPEAIADTIDELLTGFETAATGQQSPVTIEQTAAEQPQTKRYRKKPAVDPEKGDRELAFDWLKLWHRYGTTDFNAEPIPGKTKRQLWMKAENNGTPGPSPSTFTRMFEEKFGNHKTYLIACRTERIEQLLTVAAGDATRVFQQQPQRERSTTVLEPDLD